ncbi:MAG: cytochrome b N-terminal domain-containing protein [Verrucomicrobiota bacterium]|nr:cytochrome b N-terminal domain-containing protein [Verrucomicrobiota bacterium]
MGRWQEWFKERFPSSWIKTLLQEEIPGGARFSYTLGSAALFLFVVLTLTGLWQMFVYVPTIDYAYQSLAFLRLNIPFGWLIHGLHYWGGTLFCIVVGLHGLRTFIWGAYKKPREMIWLSGIILLCLTAAFMFTGPILPWDKKGYWACKVGLSMLGDMPGIGRFLQNILQGESAPGQATLSRMFTIHIALLPLITVGMIAIHLIAFRKAGSAGSWKKEEQQVRGQFWPEQIFKDMVVSIALFLLLVGLTVFARPPFGGISDPLDTTYVPKPEWNFLFLYQFLKFFHGRWEPIGILLVPLFILFLFFSLPFFDRNPERDPAKRIFVIASGGLFVSLTFLMMIFGFLSHPPSELSPQLVKAKTTPLQRSVSTNPEALHSLGKSAHLIGDQENGEVLYNLYCMECHGPKGDIHAKDFYTMPGVPALSPIQSAFYSPDPQLFVDKIDPVLQHGLPNPAGGLNMPAFGDLGALTQAQIADVEAYLLQLNQVDRAKILRPGMDPLHFFLLLVGAVSIGALLLLKGVR